MTTFNTYAAHEPGGALQPFTYDPGTMASDEVEIRVTACGLCHSDLSMIKNEWRRSQYPLVPGHEVIGEVVAVGEGVATLKPGQMVGVGWTSHSCLHCSPCLSGRQQRCTTGVSTIAGRGGFADRIRVQHVWAVPLPDGIDSASAGPLFCGGITVFAPFIDFDLKPTDRIGIVGIGGLGHLAVQFAHAWGCEVTAFTSSMDKEAELRDLGAHRIVNSRDDAALKAERGRFDYILSTVNVSLNWRLYLSALRAEGKLITVGMVPEAMAIPAGLLIGGQRIVSGSDTGPPDRVATMLEFCARHDIKPMIETFPMAECNAAIERLESGQARYRVVLEN
ncbi:MAG: NAD(P)-dependent alcohol dehydrogenase [Litorimonas sp.]